jgi:diacylglycerol kinase (ATP)
MAELARTGVADVLAPSRHETPLGGPRLADSATTRERPAGEAARKRIVVIYNPTAGWRQRGRFQRTLRLLAMQGCSLAVHETRGPGEAGATARAAVEAGCDAVAVAGGDGTIGEVVNGLAGLDAAVAIIPLGTANVLAAEIGLSRDPETVAATIVHGAARTIHIGRMGDHRFVMMAGVGFDARVVAGVRRGLKRAIGKYAYVVEAVRQILRYRPVTFEVEIEGETMRAASVVLANGRSYAGRYTVAPDARLEQPRFQVCLQTKAGRWHVLRYALAMLTGRLHRLSDVRIVPAHCAVIRGPITEPIQADGDIIGTTPAAFSIARERITLLTPAGD